MASSSQFAEPISQGYTLGLNTESSATNSNNRPLTFAEMDVDNIYPLAELHEHRKHPEFDDPEYWLNKYYASFMRNYLEKNGTNLATPIGKSDRQKGSYGSNYVQQHAKFFGIKANPYIKQAAQQEPESGSQHSKGSKDSNESKELIDPRLLGCDAVAQEAHSEQGASGPSTLSIPQSTIDGLLKDIQIIEPLLADESWVSILDPLTSTAPAAGMGLESSTGLTPYIGSVPYTEPASSVVPVSTPGPASHTNPVSNAEQLSYMDLEPYMEPAFGAQTVSPMKTIFNQQLDSYPQEGFSQEPVSFSPLIPSPQPVSYTQPAAFTEPASHAGPAFNPQPMFLPELTFEPQHIDAQNIDPALIAMSPPPAPGTYVQEREKFQSRYYNKMSAVEYGTSTRKYIGQQFGFSTSCEPTAENPSRGLPPASISFQQPAISPKGKGKTPCVQQNWFEDILGDFQ
ncbi:hypothetical protein Daesc_004668 [Daldinia eschscholtzii]|uniref:Uncharacterized protein n=1 Tax=Daldinia eschscholtzii TaxID=292717 RepID=A0AAX6MPV6_9PEZI